VFRTIGIALAAAVAVWLAGLEWFVASSLEPAADGLRPTDAIVVLTGGSLRLESGIALLGAGKGRKLFVSGVNREVDRDELLRALGRQSGQAECCIVLGHAADNTLGNARETARWMREEEYRSLRLVTGWYHMRRSVLEFARAMPEIEIVPHPVFPPAIPQTRWWAHRASALLVIGEYNKYLATLMRPVVGYTDPLTLPLRPPEPQEVAGPKPSEAELGQFGQRQNGAR